MYSNNHNNLEWLLLKRLLSEIVVLKQTKIHRGLIYHKDVISDDCGKKAVGINAQSSGGWITDLTFTKINSRWIKIECKGETINWKRTQEK